VKEEKPVTKVGEPKNPEDKPYLAADAVPEVDGKVVYTLDLNVPGRNATEIFDEIYSYLDKMSQGSNQVNSGIALFNKKERTVAAKFSEWMEFSKSFIMIDRTKFNYTIIAKCSDNHLNMTLERISYNYEENREGGFRATAEKYITDKYAVNKKRTKLIPGVAKFRRGTIDRKNQIFAAVKSLFK